MSREKRNGPQQVNVLKRLNQQAAAWLIGCTSRTLRDWPEAPRNADGSYDGQALVAWWKDRQPRPELSDDDYERLIVAQAALSDGHWSEGEALSIVDTLQAVRAKYGETVWLAFIDTWIADITEWLEPRRDRVFRTDSEADVRRRVNEEIARQEARVARDRLQIATVCEKCGKLRHGRRWAKADPPEGYVVQTSYCPACEA